MADGTFKINEYVTISAFPEDAASQPAPVIAGSFGWTSDPEGIVVLTPSEDGTTCKAAGVASGAVIVTCIAINVAGTAIDGMAELELSEVPAPLAVHIRLVVGEPTPQ